MDFPIKRVIFYGYVKLPEGILGICIIHTGIERRLGYIHIEIFHGYATGIYNQHDDYV